MELKQESTRKYDVIVIGGGSAGLAAAVSAFDNGANTLIVEREARAGGILKQCIHDGFGVITFDEKLTGPEYAERYIHMVRSRNIELITSTYVTDLSKEENYFRIVLVNQALGVFEVMAHAVVLATGCREKTSKQVFITGTRPAGIYTAGTAQYFVNIMGYLPCRRCVILGSGDIGLIMARRLTLEGAEVVGVFEAKNTPSGLARNIDQCLKDYHIPLELSHTVTKVYGEDHVTAVEISEVDDNMKPVEGSQRTINCDAVILSVGLIPENELAQLLGVQFDRNTKGPMVDQTFMTNIAGVFSCGNALHVNDLVDYVTESGVVAGRAAAVTSSSYYQQATKQEIIVTVQEQDFLYVVPQRLTSLQEEQLILYFRSKNIESKVVIQLDYNGEIILEKEYEKLRPPEMERLVLDLKALLKGRNMGGELRLAMKR